MSKRIKPAARRKDGSVIPMIGEAQRQGYVNRFIFRQEVRDMNRKKKLNSGNRFQLGVMRDIPIPPANVLKRRKLKYWQKVA